MAIFNQEGWEKKEIEEGIDCDVGRKEAQTPSSLST